MTVDIALLRKSSDSPEVLLIKRGREPFKNYWAFPGGFVDENESLEIAAARELREETGLRRIRLEQIGAFGDPGRDPRGHTVSIVFGSLLSTRLTVHAADDAIDAAWHPVRRPPPLAFDHRKILRAVIRHFRIRT